jgi:hypothetical protein
MQFTGYFQYLIVQHFTILSNSIIIFNILSNIVQHIIFLAINLSSIYSQLFLALTVYVNRNCNEVHLVWSLIWLLVEKTMQSFPHIFLNQKYRLHQNISNCIQRTRQVSVKINFNITVFLISIYCLFLLSVHYWNLDLFHDFWKKCDVFFPRDWITHFII